jgi:DNA mismatch repair protein MLH1
VLKDSVIIGSVSSRKLLIQSGNTMYLLDMTAFSRELIYQECLQKFGEMKVFELEEPAPIAELVMLALESEIELRQKPSEAPSLVAAAAQQLIVDKRELLSQYYGIMISEDGCIVALPEVIEGYVPTNLDGLPVFLFNLYSRLSWQDEKDTFDKVARELATLYAIPTEEDPEELKGSSGGPPALVSSGVAWAIEHQILPSLKRRFSPPPTLHQTHAITSVVSTDKLFKIFERC